MNDRQRDVVFVVALVLALVLFVSFFGVDFWRWATWRQPHDLLSQFVTIKPDFPHDAKNVGLGLVLPVLLAGFAYYLKSGGGPDSRGPDVP